MIHIFNKKDNTPMPHYLSQESLDGNVQADTAVGMPTALAETLKSSAITQLLAQYIQLGFEQGKFETVDDARNALKTVCNEALSNGDITADVYDRVCQWMDSRSYSLEGLNLRRPVEADTMVRKCFSPSFTVTGKVPSKLWKEFLDLSKACEAKFDEMVQAYGPHIRNCMGEFLRLYGKSLDKDLRDRLNV